MTEIKESCRIHQRLLHHMGRLLICFAIAMFTTMLALAEGALFPYCATHECCASSGGVEGLIYSLTLLINTFSILATGYYALTTSYYYVYWKSELKKEKST